MNLDDAIKHCEEVAEKNYGRATAYLSDREVYKHEEQKCVKCADEHMQLAEWLRDYKRLKEQEPSGDCISRQAVLEEIFKKPAWHNSDGSYYHADDIRDAVNSVKPQTGHWIEGQTDNPNIHNILCSCCFKGRCYADC